MSPAVACRCPSSRQIVSPLADVPLVRWCRRRSGSALSVSRSLAMFSHERCVGSVLLSLPEGTVITTPLQRRCVPPRRVQNGVLCSLSLSPAIVSVPRPQTTSQCAPWLLRVIAYRVGRPLKLALSLRDGSNHFEPSSPRRRVAFARVVDLLLAYSPYRLCVPRSLLDVLCSVCLGPKPNRP